MGQAVEGAHGYKAFNEEIEGRVGTAAVSGSLGYQAAALGPSREARIMSDFEN